MLQQTILALEDTKRITAATRAEAERNGWAGVSAVRDHGSFIAHAGVTAL